MIRRLSQWIGALAIGAMIFLGTYWVTQSGAIHQLLGIEDHTEAIDDMTKTPVDGYSGAKKEPMPQSLSDDGTEAEPTDNEDVPLDESAEEETEEEAEETTNGTETESGPKQAEETNEATDSSDTENKADTRTYYY